MTFVRLSTGIVGMVQELLNAANKAKIYLEKSEKTPPTAGELSDKLKKVSELVPLIEA